MRPVLGTTQRAVARRWANLSRLSTLTLTRDAFDASPGATLTLALGERTAYRQAAQILDEFLRATFGGFYDPPDGFTGLTLPAFGEVSAAVGAGPNIETHGIVLPRDQWAEVRILDCTAGGDSGTRAAVGVGLRWSPPSGTGRGYLVMVEQLAADAVRRTTVYRYRDGALESTLADEAHPWVIGDTVRAEAYYHRLRVYRNGTLVLETEDADPLLVDGRAAISVGRAVSGDLATLTDFLGGALRREYIGAVADLGDVTASLGLLEPTASPAAWDLALVNLAKMGGASRFAALIRHGLNDALGTYDWPRARAKVWTEIDGGSGPLRVADGKLDGMGGMTEDRVRLAFRGRDAFLQSLIEPGPVNYLPGDDPLLTTAPVPDDPACGFDDDPDVVPGDPPAEPPPDDGSGDGGTGEPPPEEEEEPGGGDGDAPLAGTWRITWSYTLDEFGEYAGSTTVEEIPDEDHAEAGYTDHDLFHPEVIWTIGTGTATEPGVIQETWIYRGPDVDGSDLVRSAHNNFPELFDTALGIRGHLFDTGGDTGVEFGMLVKLARYDGADILSVSDLEALRPKNPGELEDPLPARVETLAEWTLPITFGGGGAMVQDSSIPMNLSAGPQLIRIEIHSTEWPDGGTPDRSIRTSLETYLHPFGSPETVTALATTGVGFGTNLGATLE